MERFDRRRLILLAIPALLVVALVVLLSSGLLVVGVGPMRINTSPAAITTGPVSVDTNHSRYLATDSIDITVTNHLSTPIYTRDARAFCSILTLEVLQRGAWVPSYAAACGCPWSCAAIHCHIVRAPRLVTINPGASYTATIQHNQDVPFPTGSYRLVLVYSTVPPSEESGSTLPLSTTFTTAPLDVLAVFLVPPACPYAAVFAPARQPLG